VNGNRVRKGKIKWKHIWIIQPQPEHIRKWEILYIK